MRFVLARVLIDRQSVGIGRSGLSDSNPVVRKFVMHARDVVFRHMAGDTILRTDWAGSACVVSGGTGVLCRVAIQAALIVECWILCKRFVGIVASDACDSRVPVSPAAALFQPVGRKT